jgi:hypothetical protein
MPQADWKKAATYGLETEKSAFTSLPDRVSVHPFFVWWTTIRMATDWNSKHTTLRCNKRSRTWSSGDTKTLRTFKTSSTPTLLRGNNSSNSSNNKHICKLSDSNSCS